MRSSSLVSTLAPLAAVGVLLFAAAPAQAEDVRVTVIVSHASAKQGPMEQPKLLPPGFNFQSHRVLQSETLTIGMNQEAKHRLPNGKSLKLRPTEKREKNLMMHVEVEGATVSNLRMRSGKRVTIRHPEPYQGGNLLVHLEARF
ncbi:MAG: hypothetical protein HKP30_14685 [Myxococcales bacterium]|nr:hypothetical protein [Myxococcales bacterium]